MKINSRHFFIAFSLVTSITIFSCKNNEQKHDENQTSVEQTEQKIDKPNFNADSAYAFVQHQVDFGPRVPGTPAQKKCADWMAEKLKVVCDTVYRQDVQVKAGNGKMLPCMNVIGSINPSAKRRVLLLTHWDSRPWADNDVVDKDKPILAADDGGSGVAVLIELARAIKSKPLPKDLGVDILMADVEDYGKSEWGDDSYALGTQYWAHHPHVPNYKAQFGILLDMVGARDALFSLEATSTHYAGAVQQNVWSAANTAGYSSYFPFVADDAITDDHVFVNKIIGIPTIDIINLNNKTESAFAPHWHTHNDNMSVIDKNTLNAVGNTLLQVIYEMVQPKQNA